MACHRGVMPGRFGAGLTTPATGQGSSRDDRTSRSVVEPAYSDVKVSPLTSIAH